MVPTAPAVTEKFSAARQKVAVALLLRRSGVDVDVAGEVGGVGCGAEAGDFGVEADGDVEVVVAGEEEEGVALGAELVVLLDGVDAIDLGLHGGGGRGGREDGDVGAEVGGLGEGGEREEGESEEQGSAGEDGSHGATGYALGQAIVL